MRKLAQLLFILLFFLGTTLSGASLRAYEEGEPEICHSSTTGDHEIASSVSLATADECDPDEKCDCNDCPACHAQVSYTVSSVTEVGRFRLRSNVWMGRLDRDDGITLSLPEEPPIL